MKDILNKDKDFIWHPYTSLQTEIPVIAIKSAKGSRITDDDGKEYIDAISSWWVNIHGHCHPYIQQKITEQVQELDHVIFADFTHKPAVQTAEKLLNILPANQKKIFYSDNGSTAVEVALKMALQYWYNQNDSESLNSSQRNEHIHNSVNHGKHGDDNLNETKHKKKRNKIIAFKNAYHGDTFGAMSVADRGPFNKAFHEHLFDVDFIDAPVQGKEAESLEQLKAVICEETACFIFEPLLQGAGGMIMYEPAPLDKMLKLCQTTGVVTIADEVLTGFGRTGKTFASLNLQTPPDIMCLSKAITGGFFPLGVTACSRKISQAYESKDRFKTFFHGHSYTANPIILSAAVASLELLEKSQNEIDRITLSHTEFLQKLKKNRHVKNARSIGTVLAFDIDTNEETSYFNSIRDELYLSFLQYGVVLRPLGNVIYVMPPYCINADDLNLVYSTIERVLLEKFG